jgi:hypothetical protein
MVTTFAAFNAVIQSEINDNTAERLLQIESWTNDAHYEICNDRDWNFLQKISDEITLTSANTPYDFASLAVATVATPCRKILDVLDVDYSPEKPLIFCTDQQLRAAGVDYSGYTSLPEYWMISAAKLKVFPGLDATGRGYKIRFVRDASTYAAGSTNALLIPDRWIMALKAAVLFRCWQWLADARSALALANYQNLLKQMRQEDAGEAPIVYSQWFLSRSRLPRLVTGV